MPRPGPGTRWFARRAACCSQNRDRPAAQVRSARPARPAAPRPVRGFADRNGGVERLAGRDQVTFLQELRRRSSTLSIPSVPPAGPSATRSRGLPAWSRNSVKALVGTLLVKTACDRTECLRCVVDGQPESAAPANMIRALKESRGAGVADEIDLLGDDVAVSVGSGPVAHDERVPFGRGENGLPPGPRSS